VPEGRREQDGGRKAGPTGTRRAKTAVRARNGAREGGRTGAAGGADAADAGAGRDPARGGPAREDPARGGPAREDPARGGPARGGPTRGARDGARRGSGARGGPARGTRDGGRRDGAGGGRNGGGGGASGSDARGLPRGPQALPRAEVAAHQRERLVEAMIQAVNERGVVATTISDLVARAGISRRTFYEHFENKEDCLLATYDTVVETEARRLLEVYAARDGWLEQLEAMIRALFVAIAQRPDAARLICVEMGASGTVGVQRWADGAARFERFISRGFAQAPGPGTIPDAVARAIVGALRKVVYSRVRAERTNKALKQDLLRLVPELMEWIACYYPTPPAIPEHVVARKSRWIEGGRAPGSFSPPTPWAVRGLPRGEHNLPRGFVVFNQRERIFDAIARLTASGGYQALSLEEIAAAAAISLQTFYTHFESKEEAFLATYEVGHSRAKAAIDRSLAKQTDWIGGVRAGILALLEFLASEPALAHLACVDILIAYPHVAGRVEEANAAYTQLLDLDLAGSSPASDSPPLVNEAIVGGVFELLHDYILRGQTRRLPELANHVGYIVLAPFIGREAAAEAVTAR
jgi:AcrR family transcriptional regulator